MLKSGAMPFLISCVVFTIVSQGCLGEVRTKRQAPSVNVHQIPKTSFSCEDRTVGEYYADPEVFCQVYHVCVPGMHNKMSLISFVCPNGTIFSQATRVCTPWDRVDCSLTRKFYDSVNGQHDSALIKNDADYEDNYVPAPAPARKPQTPAPQTTPRQEPARNSNNRFRSSQFRNQQTTTTTQAPTTPARLPSRAAFRPPQAPVRPPVLPANLRPAPQPVNLRPAPQNVNLRPTARAVVSTSTSSYNFEYEYDYEYEDDQNAADQPKPVNARSKRSAGFSCDGKVPGGAYADVESDCEMFHICVLLGKDKILDYKVSCGNGTAFDQETGYCREKEEFDCQNAQLFYQYDKQKQPQFTKKLVPGKKKYMKPMKKIVNKE